MLTELPTPRWHPSVHTLETGDREFLFYRNSGADMMLNESDINEKIIAESRIFHYVSGACPYRSVISCFAVLHKRPVSEVMRAVSL